MSKPYISDRLITVVGIVFILLYLLAFWLPPRCPLFRRVASSCSRPGSTVILSPEQKILALYPHQDIETDNAFFEVNSQSDRTNTAVHFAYLPEDLDHAVAVLQLQVNGNYQNEVLISQPLLTSLNWPKVSESNLILFQKTLVDQSLNDLTQHLPTPAHFAADEAAATRLGLKSNQYTPLETLTSLDGIDTILTSRPDTIKDGQWYLFTAYLNLQNVSPTSVNTLNWNIRFLAGVDDTHLFHLGIVHVDYADR